jgi:hypothetical protein
VLKKIEPVVAELHRFLEHICCSTDVPPDLICRPKKASTAGLVLFIEAIFEAPKLIQKTTYENNKKKKKKNIVVLCVVNWLEMVSKTMQKLLNSLLLILIFWFKIHLARKNKEEKKKSISNNYTRVNA